MEDAPNIIMKKLDDVLGSINRDLALMEEEEED